MGGRAVFLDRDGVINEAFVRGGKSYPPDRLEEFRLLPGVREAVQSLHDAGFKLIVVTNQPDVRTGKQVLSVVEAMHAKLKTELPIDDIRACYHIDEDGCDCRKPKAGMLLDAAKDWDVDLSRAFMVGDRWGDIEAGQAAGCKTIFIDCGYAEKQPESPDYVVHSLAEAVPIILSEVTQGD